MFVEFEGVDTRTGEMYEFYEAGATLQEIGERFGVTRATVRRLFVVAGLNRRSRWESRALRRRLVAEERSGEICSAFAKVGDARVVAGDLGLPICVVEDAVKGRFPVTAFRRPRPKSVVYTDEELIRALRVIASQVDGGLTVGAYERLGESQRSAGLAWPTVSTHCRRFGSWRRALRNAGVAGNSFAPRAGHFKFGEQDCVDALRGATLVLGKVPTAGEYREFSEGVGDVCPSQTTIRNRFGTWYQALQKAGL